MPAIIPVFTIAIITLVFACYVIRRVERDEQRRGSTADNDDIIIYSPENNNMSSAIVHSYRSGTSVGNNRGGAFATEEIARSHIVSRSLLITKAIFASSLMMVMVEQSTTTTTTSTIDSKEKKKKKNDSPLEASQCTASTGSEFSLCASLESSRGSGIGGGYDKETAPPSSPSQSDDDPVIKSDGPATAATSAPSTRKPQPHGSAV